MEYIPEKVSFPAIEHEILEFWEKNDAFQESVRRSVGKPEFTFYDGPPFATGLPHYGHLLTGTIKDVVTRFAHQTGHYVSRRFGWDCHGLPIEFEIEKLLGIKTKEEVLKFGIPNYNRECRNIVMKYSQEWEKTVTRLGRWIDFKNDYKTMDLNFMESVWHIFSLLYKKNLVYRGVKVMPYSNGCTTPLSNFEATSSYKDVPDPEVYVTFPAILDAGCHGNVGKSADGSSDVPIISAGEEVSLIAWTTTPWTLPSNLALCVNPILTYVKFVDTTTSKTYIMMECRLPSLPLPDKYKPPKPAAGSGGSGGGGGKKSGAAAANNAESGGNNNAGGGGGGGDKKKEKEVVNEVGPYKVICRFKGEQLFGLCYQPLFPYFYDDFKATGFRVVCDEYVKDNAGTGVVHQAPAFGEDDYKVCIHHSVIRPDSRLPCPLDPNGHFIEPVKDFLGTYIKDADKAIIRYLKEHGRLLKSGTIVHSYPFCWRSDTPLIYKAVPSWFVKVRENRSKLLDNLKETYWVPDYVKEKRFHNWIADAPDWAISRSRYWGTPIPIWTNSTFDEIVVIGSIAELESLSGQKITDLHRENIDHIEIPSPSGRSENLKRIEEVFDCWFESGSMPYAQVHYPFSISEEEFHKKFPADFIAEGIDQTRGWFYTLLVLSTLLFDKVPFKNLIVNGLVCAADGKKMSKRLKNYPDPTYIIDSYGADSLRMYLINSPVVRGNDLHFKEPGVFSVVKEMLLPLFNAFRFLNQNILLFQDLQSSKLSSPYLFTPNFELPKTSENIMDKWIISSTHSLVRAVRKEMSEYHLFTVLPKLLNFIEQLTNWYVRFNRKRLRGSTGDEGDTLLALNVLFYVLLTLSKTLAPFTPFFAEYLYQHLKKCILSDSEHNPLSVHWAEYPQVDDSQSAFDENIEKSMSIMQSVILLGRTSRERRKLPLKTPLSQLTILLSSSQQINDLKILEYYIHSELNVQSVQYSTEEELYISYSAKPNNVVLGKRLRNKAKQVRDALSTLSHDQLKAFISTQRLEVCGEILTSEDLLIDRNFIGDKVKYEAEWNNDVVVILDVEVNSLLLAEATARNVASRIQRLRKDSGVTISDKIEVFYELKEAEHKAVIEGQRDFIRNLIDVPFLPLNLRPRYSQIVGELNDTINIEGLSAAQLYIQIVPFQFCISRSGINGLKSSDDYDDLQSYVSAFVYSKLASALEANSGKFRVSFNGNNVDLILGETIFPSVYAMLEHAKKK